MLLLLPFGDIVSQVDLPLGNLLNLQMVETVININAVIGTRGQLLYGLR